MRYRVSDEVKDAIDLGNQIIGLVRLQSLREKKRKRRQPGGPSAGCNQMKCIIDEVNQASLSDARARVSGEAESGKQGRREQQLDELPPLLPHKKKCNKSAMIAKRTSQRRPN